MQAQSDGILPLSRAGLGQLHNPNLPSLSLMGGLSAAYHDAYRPSVSNPASLGHLDVTAFDIGAVGQFNRLEEGDLSENYWNGRFNHLTLSFPIYNPVNEIIENEKYKFRWGAQIALRNNSTVNYDIITTTLDTDLGPTAREFIGDGGTFTLELNQGWKYKNTAVGLGIGMLSGEIGFDRIFTIQDEFRARRTNLSRDYTVRGFLYNLGVQHDIYLRKNTDKNIPKGRIPRIQLGATYHTTTSFTTTSEELAVAEFLSGSNWIPIDTTLNSIGEPIQRTGTHPSELNIGAIYHSGNKFQIGVNYYMGGWSAYENFADPSVLNDTWRFSVGGTYTPNPQSFRNVFKRSIYKFGAFTGNDPRTFITDGDVRTQVTHQGVTAGIEMPFAFQRQFAFVNLGVELGRYDLENTIRRNYFSIQLGITMTSNQWFLKRKYN